MKKPNPALVMNHSRLRCSPCSTTLSDPCGIETEGAEALEESIPGVLCTPISSISSLI